MRAYAVAVAIFSALSMFVYVYSGNSQSRIFADTDCAVDCTGHAAGYAWAQTHDIDDASDCPAGNAQSFHEGCIAYTRNPNRRAQANMGSIAGAGPAPRPFDDDDDADQ